MYLNNDCKILLYKVSPVLRDPSPVIMSSPMSIWQWAMGFLGPHSDKSK